MLYFSRSLLHRSPLYRSLVWPAERRSAAATGPLLFLLPRTIRQEFFMSMPISEISPATKSKTIAVGNKAAAGTLVATVEPLEAVVAVSPAVAIVSSGAAVPVFQYARAEGGGGVVGQTRAMEEEVRRGGSEVKPPKMEKGVQRREMVDSGSFHS